MNVDQFDFLLPPESIALYPAIPRDSARLLLVRPGLSLQDYKISDLSNILKPSDVLVFNDTRVVPAELLAERKRNKGVPISITFTLVQRLEENRWRAFSRPARRLKVGDTISFKGSTLEAEISNKYQDGQVDLVFNLSGDSLDQLVARAGHLALPPYITKFRSWQEQDFLHYQTCYARHDGAIAAPTAGLHFTPELLLTLEKCGVSFQFVTLHVGLGTFLPVKVRDTQNHNMHAEWGCLSQKTAQVLNDARLAGRRIIAVGTTTLRLLETVLDPYTNQFQPFIGTTSIFLTPGVKIRGADALMTNFHLPRSTLFMLVAAFSGLNCMKDAYKHAIAAGYRFYSYGDASLLFPEAFESL